MDPAAGPAAGPASSNAEDDSRFPGELLGDPAAGPAEDERSMKRYRDDSRSPGELLGDPAAEPDACTTIQSRWERICECEKTIKGLKTQAEELDAKLAVRNEYLDLSAIINDMISGRRVSRYPEEEAIFADLDTTVDRINAFTRATSVWNTERHILDDDIERLEDEISTCRQVITDLQMVPCPDYRRSIDDVPIELWAMIFMFVGGGLFRGSIMYDTHTKLRDHVHSKVWLVSKHWSRAWNYIRIDDRVRMMMQLTNVNWRYNSRFFASGGVGSTLMTMGRLVTINSVVLKGGRYLFEGIKRTIVLEQADRQRIVPCRTMVDLGKNRDVLMIISVVTALGDPDDPLFQVYVKVHPWPRDPPLHLFRSSDARLYHRSW